MCEQCKLLQSGTAVAEEGEVLVFVAPTAIPSMLLVPRQHGQLFEQKKEVQEKLFQTATTISSFLFDRLQLHGTNILCNDGEHAYYTIVGRNEEDGLDLRWIPKRASPEELESHVKRISEETWYIGKKERTSTPKEGKVEIIRPGSPALPVQKTPMSMPPSSEESKEAREAAKDIQDAIKDGPKETHDHKDEHNYLLRQLTRRR